MSTGHDAGKLVAMETIELESPKCTVRLARNSRARRFTLRLEPSGGGAVLTVPPGVPMTECRGFLRRHSAWLDRALARQPAVIDVRPGVSLPIDGVSVTVEARPGKRRAVHLEDQVLIVPGPGAPGPRIAAWLKEHARSRLGDAARHYATQLGTKVRAVAFRDTTSRWGSCSSRGTLSFSWRLAMAPIDVQDYVAAHEAAHLIEMNHSPKFWALVDKLMPDWQSRRDWLKREGRNLHTYRFD